MAVSIRFRRCGRRNRPFHRIVVADSRSPRDGRFIEIIGHYNSIANPEIVEIKRDRLLHWLSCGANPSKSLKSILSRNGIWKEVTEELNRFKGHEKSGAEKPSNMNTEFQAEVEAAEE